MYWIMEKEFPILKRVILFAFLLSTLGLLALAPMNLNLAPEYNAKLQATVIATAIVASPVLPGSSNPATTGMPSSMIIIGLLIVLGIGVVVGGAALMSRRE